MLVAYCVQDIQAVSNVNIAVSSIVVGQPSAVLTCLDGHYIAVSNTVKTLKELMQQKFGLVKCGDSV